MTLEILPALRDDFVAAARRRLEWVSSGWNCTVDPRASAQSFFRRTANQRTERLRGNPANRGRFLREDFRAVREGCGLRTGHGPSASACLSSMIRDETDPDRIHRPDQALKADGLDMISVRHRLSIPDSKSRAPASWVRLPAGTPRSGAFGIVPHGVLASRRLPKMPFKDGQLTSHVSAKSAIWPTRTGLTSLPVELGIDKASWTCLPPYAHWLERFT